MIIRPIIPIWLMSIICITLVAVIIYNKRLREINKNKVNNIKTERKKNFIKDYAKNVVIKIIIVILLFIINLRFMIPNGEAITTSPDVSILFVIDTSISMKALDYNRNQERMKGVKADCTHIIDELSGCKFSVLKFDDTTQKLMPFTTDGDMVDTSISGLALPNPLYAEGTSLNIVKEPLEELLKEEKKKQSENTKFFLFFISDGEITKESETLESFANISQYLSGGAVLGYGTTQGRKNGR